MNEERKSMNALGGRGMCAASFRFGRVGPSAGELGGDIMNMVDGSGGGG